MPETQTLTHIQCNQIDTMNCEQTKRSTIIVIVGFKRQINNYVRANTAIIGHRTQYGTLGADK